MLDDPLGVPRPVVPKKKQPDFRDEFWQEAPTLRPTRRKPHERRENPGTRYICRYLNGRHEQPPQPWCPHYSHEDETGKRIRPEWNVQWDMENGAEPIDRPEHKS